MAEQRTHTEMLPCPFCRSRRVEMSGATGVAYVWCRECHTDGPLTDSVDEALALWNTRYISDEHDLSTSTGESK